MSRSGYWDAKSGMRYLLIGQLERVALAQGPDQREQAVNMLVSLATPWTRGDKQYEEEEREIMSGGLEERAGRYAIVQAVVCSLARQGMLDTPEPPSDRSRFLDEPDEGEGVHG